MKSRPLSGIAFLLSILPLAPPALAQSVTFQGVTSTPSVTGSTYAVGLAADHFGHLYILDQASNSVFYTQLGGATSRVAVPFTGLKNPVAIAVDNLGNVYVADSGNNRVVKVTAAGGQSNVVTGLNSPQGVAVDSAGDVFVADTENNRIVKVFPSGATGDIGIGLTLPQGLAVDAAGNLYVADKFNDRIVKISPIDESQTNVLTGLNDPAQIAVDAVGNVFTNGRSGGIVEALAGSSVTTAVLPNIIGLYNALTVDGNGNLFAVSEPNQTFYQSSTQNVGFPDTNVCLGGATTTTPCSSTLAFSFDINAATTFGAIKVLTQGVVGLDFGGTTGIGNCIVQNYPANQVCKVYVTFAPQAPGLRMGAVQILNGSGAVLASVNVWGRGLGPQFGITTPAAVTKLITIPGVPAALSAVGVDAAGDLFVSDPVLNQVDKVNPETGTRTTITVSNLYAPSRVAVAGDGSLYIPGGNFVYKVPADGLPSSIVAQGAGGQFLGNTLVALDGRGNADVVSAQHGAVYRVSQDGTTVTLAASGTVNPSDLVEKEFAGIATTAPPWFSQPLLADASAGVDLIDPFGSGVIPYYHYFGGISSALAVDSAGDLYFANGNGVLEQSPLNIASDVSVLYPNSIATNFTRDTYGNFFIVQVANGSVQPGVLEFPAIQQPYAFANTDVGATSAESNIVITNTGNSNLSLTTLSVTGSFQIVAAGTTCSAAKPLFPADTCTLAVIFSPIAVGQATGSLAIVARDLPAPTFTLTGTGVAATVPKAQTITFAALAAVTLPAAPFALSATASSGLAVTFTSAILGVCTVNGSTLTPVAAGTCSITASQPGNAAFSAAAPVTQSFTINAAAGAPAITQGGVVPASSSSTTIQAGSWASIYGSNLANTTATWQGNFPISLGGVSVTVNGKNAYLSYVSPTQINMQAPDDTATGKVNVTITNAAGSSTSTVTLGQFGPSFLLLDGTHVAGIILRFNGSGAYGGGSYDIIGPTGTSLGYKTVAAKQGDVVELFGVGFGPTNPSVPAGQVFSGAAATTNAVQLAIAGISVTPSFVGLSGAGLYQMNLTIPAGGGTGDEALLGIVGGAQTQSVVVISLQ